MNEQKNDKKFVKTYYIISYIAAWIIIVLALSLMWLGYGELTDKDGNPTELTLRIKLTFTIVFLLILILAPFIFKFFFRHQEKLDSRQKLNTSQPNK